MPALKYIAAVLFIGASAIYGLTTLSASVPRWMVVYLWASLAVVSFVCWMWRGKSLNLDKVDGLALGLLAWAALSLSWSSDWRQGVLELTNAAALCAVFLVTRRVPDLIPEAALLSLIVAVVLQYLYPLDWGGHGNRNFQTEAVILATLIAFQTERKWAWLLLWLVLPFVGWLLFVENPSKSEFLVLPFVIAWLVYERRKRIKLVSIPRRALA